MIPLNITLIILKHSLISQIVEKFHETVHERNTSMWSLDAKEYNTDVVVVYNISL